MYVQSTHGGSIRRAISWTGIRRSDGPDRDPPQKTESEGIRQSQSIHQFLRVYPSVQFICFQFFGYYVAIGHFDVWPCVVSLQAMSPKQYSCFLRFRLLGWLVGWLVGRSFVVRRFIVVAEALISFTAPAEISFPLRVPIQGVLPFPLAGKIRPQNGGNKQLGVGRLPQHEIRQPVLPARSDDEVGGQHPSRSEASSQGIFGNVGGLEIAVLDLFCQGATGCDNIATAAVVDGQTDFQVVAVFSVAVALLLLTSRSFFELRQYPFEARRDPFVGEVAEDPHVDGREIARGPYGGGRELDRQEDFGDLGGRSIPVFRRKCVEGQAVDAGFRRAVFLAVRSLSLADQGSDEIDEAPGALEVSGGPGKVPFGGPSSVTIANQSDVPGNLLAMVLLAFVFVVGIRGSRLRNTVGITFTFAFTFAFAFCHFRIRRVGCAFACSSYNRRR